MTTRIDSTPYSSKETLADSLACQRDGLVLGATYTIPGASVSYAPMVAGRPVVWTGRGFRHDGLLRAVFLFTDSPHGERISLPPHAVTCADPVAL